MRSSCVDITRFPGALVVSIVIGLLWGKAATAGVEPLLDDLSQQTETFHLTRAREAFDALPLSLADSPSGKYLEGRLLFFENKPQQALGALRTAIEGDRARFEWKDLRNRIENFVQATGSLVSTDGTSGGFVFLHEDGPDAVLVPYANDTLNAQAAALAQTFGDTISHRVQVLLLPTVEALSQTSGLTVDQIEHTGTVGVTKYGMIMILSPRVLADGYPWLDTLAHELTHLVIDRVSQNRAPIWLHEGVAKLLEKRWEGQEITALTPDSAYLLDRAVHEKRLIPLKRFHPSISHLPNQEDAALAYAQVLSFLTYLTEQIEDPNWLAGFLHLLAQGENLDQAFSRVSKFTIRRMYLWWEQSTAGRRQTPVPAMELMKRRFRSGSTVSVSAPRESVLSLPVRRHLRIGDLLRQRGHVRPASIEYKRAVTLGVITSPEISDRLGGCLLELGDHQEVIDLLSPLAALYPTHSTAYVQLGTSLAASGKTPEAIRSLEHAVGLNPFHPDIHCALARLYAKEGNPIQSARATASCEALERFSTPDRHDPGPPRGE